MSNLLVNYLSRIGLNASQANKFNFAVIDKTVDGIRYIEYWILANAEYDSTHERFVKQDITATSFAIQIQAKGTYPGEAELGYINNTGINIWRCPIWKENESDPDYVVYMDTDYYDYTDTLANKYIGAEYDNESWGAKNGTWREFGVATGWSNNFMTDSYGGITIGGAGFEIDGNGIFPFTRLTSSKYTDENDDVYYLLGILDNAYHPDQYNDWKCDSNEYGAWFYGLKYPANNDGTKSSEDAKFVIMYNDMSSIDPTASGYTIEDMDVSDWEVILEADSTSIKAMVEGTLTTLGAGGSGSSILTQSITNGDTTHAPSGDAVYDALDNKLDKTHTSYKGKNVVTNASTGAIEFENKPTIPTGSSTATDIKMNGTQSAGSSSNFAKADHVHPSDTSKVSVAQGSANSGKFLKVNSSGDVTAETVSSMTPSSHTHGNLQNDGQVGSTAAANQNVVTDSSGKITTEAKPTIPSASSTTPSADVSGGSVGSGTTWAKADHQHPLSTAYAASTHNHALTNISDVNTVAVLVTYTDNTTETINFVKYTGS